jgi:hypothetical protein
VAFPGDDGGEPVVETAWGGIDGGVRTVDADAFLGETEERVLLGVCEGERFQAAEDDGVLWRVRSVGGYVADGRWTDGMQ